MRKLFFVAIFLIIAAACASEPETIEVTRIVENEVEVTRIVEVEVTRVVTPTALPGGVFGSPECDNYKADVSDLFGRWIDAFDIALSTSRADLSDRVVDMQAIRREALALDEPDCASPLFVQARMANMMDDGIELFTDFMAQNDISVQTASYTVTRDLATDAVTALSDEAKETPRRIHYWAFGQTGFAVEYIDESGNFVEAVPPDNSFNNRFGFDDHPVVFTALIPESERAAIRLFNPTEDNRELTCAILIDGEDEVLDSDTRELICELDK